MTRIDTVEDLVRVLDDHPEWREAVRARLLSRELLELPSRFSAFVEEMRTFVSETRAWRAEMETFVAEMKAFVAEMKAWRAEMETFVAEMKAWRAEMETFVAEMKAWRAEMETFVAEMKAWRAEMETFVAEMKAWRAEMETFVAETKRQFKSIRDDLGVLKGAHARNAAERNLGLIARSMGLRQRRILDGGELFDLARAAGADMSDDGIRSYVQADLVFEAENEQGGTEYVAVEVSYTANGRDTARAMRNAGFLAGFTGVACRPVVASLHVDDRIEDLVDSGRIAWYRMPRRALESA